MPTKSMSAAPGAGAGPPAAGRLLVWLMSLHPLPVVVGAQPGAVPAQRAVRAGRVGPLEDPVLPGRETAEDLRPVCLRAGEAQVRLQPGERVGGEAGPLGHREPDLVLPVQVVRRGGDQTEASGLRSLLGLAGGCLGGLAPGRLAGGPDGQPGLNSSRLIAAGGFGSSASAKTPSSMYWRSAAKARSSSGPVKQLPGSISAIRDRDVASARHSVRFQNWMISFTSQSPECWISSALVAAAAARSPSVLI